eukprot:Opistho-2@84185
MNLEDKILHGPTRNAYISDDDDDLRDEDSDDSCCSEPTCANELADTGAVAGAMPAETTGVGGPKGVLADYRRHQRAAAEQRKDDYARLVKEAGRMSLRGGGSEAQAEPSADEDEEAFMREYREKRLREIQQRQKADKGPRFGTYELMTSATFVDQIEDEPETVPVIVHLFQEGVASCALMSAALSHLARKHPYAKFRRMRAEEASRGFDEDSLPTLLVYRAGELVGNHVRVADSIGERFAPDEVEDFLVRHGFLERLVYQVSDDSTDTD